MSRNFVAPILVAAFLSTGCAAYAGRPVENDALAVSRAKISITQAIASAEQQTHGRAVKAKYEENDNILIYEIEVVSDNKAFDVKVDAEKGTVISSVEDRPDHNRGKNDAYYRYNGHNKEESWR